MGAWQTASWIGERHEQQDAVRTAGGTAVVCDGLGGHPGGAEIAPAVARMMLELVTARTQDMTKKGLEGHDLETALDEVFARVRENSGGTGFADRAATTLTAVTVTPDGLLVINVGDSPAYLVTAGGEAMWEVGDRMHDPYNPRMVSSVVWAGARDEVHVTRHFVPLRENDLVIAATDGLDVLEAEEVRRIASAQPDAAAGELTSAVMARARERQERGERTRQDNTTVAVLRIAAEHATWPVEPDADRPGTWLHRDGRNAGGPLLRNGERCADLPAFAHGGEKAGTMPRSMRREIAGRLVAQAGGDAADGDAVGRADREIVTAVRTPWWRIRRDEVRRILAGTGGI